MRDRESMVEVRPSLIGTLSTIGGTAVGIPVDTLGFKEVLGILVAGAVAGSTGSTVNLAIKVQESASPAGTGAGWSDITNGAICAGSFNFTTLIFGGDLAGGTTTGTWLPYQMDKQSEKVCDGRRLRYIRAHATLSGTVGIGPKFAATFVLGRPIDTLYAANAVTMASTNVELTKLL